MEPFGGAYQELDAPIATYCSSIMDYKIASIKNCVIR